MVDMLLPDERDQDIDIEQGNQKPSTSRYQRMTAGSTGGAPSGDTSTGQPL